mgnify:CR=1 FL=1
MPFPCEVRSYDLEAVFRGGPLPRAVRAADPQVPVAYQGFPFMTLPAHPPRFFVGTGDDIPRGQRTVLYGVPLTGEPGIYRLQAIVPADRSAGAIRTSRAAGPAAYVGLPLMAFPAFPPDFFPGTGGHVFRRERRIPRGMPLPREGSVCFIKRCFCFFLHHVRLLKSPTEGANSQAPVQEADRPHRPLFQKYSILDLAL